MNADFYYARHYFNTTNYIIALNAAINAWHHAITGIAFGVMLQGLLHLKALCSQASMLTSQFSFLLNFLAAVITLPLCYANTLRLC